MSSEREPLNSDLPDVVGRRSTRLSMIVPITIQGTDRSGQGFKENTWTIGINKQGARIATFHNLASGSQLLILNPVLGRTAKGHVIWIGEKRFPEDPYEVGVELTEDQNVWGIDFPPEDWQKQGTLGSRSRGQEKSLGDEAAAGSGAAASEQGTQAEAAQVNLAVAALSRFAQEAEGGGQGAPTPSRIEPSFPTPSSDAVRGETEPASGGNNLQRDWVDQTQRELERSIRGLCEALQKQLEGVCRASLERARAETEKLLEEVRKRLEQAATALRPRS